MIVVFEIKKLKKLECDTYNYYLDKTNKNTYLYTDKK